jgi:hypothetical protein
LGAVFHGQLLVYRKGHLMEVRSPWLCILCLLFTRVSFRVPICKTVWILKLASFQSAVPETCSSLPVTLKHQFWPRTVLGDRQRSKR